MKISFGSYFVLLVIILSFPFLIKYVFVNHNQYEQLPLIFRYLDPTYLNNDWSVNLNAQFSPRIFFTAYIAILSKFFSIPFIYLAHYLINILLISTATFYFTNRIYKSNLIGLMTTVIVLYGQKITLGGNDLIGRDFDPSRPAFALVITAFVLLCSNKFYSAAILLSLSSYLHPLIGIELPIIFYFSLLLSIYINNRKKAQMSTIKNMLPALKSLALYLLLSCISFYSYAISFFSDKNQFPTGMLFTIVSKVVAPFHYSPSTWNFFVYFKFALLSLMFAYFFRNRSKNLSPFLILFVKNCIKTIVFICLIGFFFTEIYHFYPVMIAQLFRLTVFLYWLFSIFVYGGLFFLGYTYSQKNSFYIVFPVLPFIISQIDSFQRPTKSLLISLTLSLVIALVLKSGSKKSVKLMLIALTVLSLALPYRHYQFKISSLYPFQTPETEIALWVSKNTKPESVFLTPPEFIRFRLVANRAIVVDRLVTPFSESGIIQWMQRIKDVSGLNDYETENIKENLIYEGYKKIDTERIEYLKSKYLFDYVIVEKGKLLPMIEIFSDSNFRIYKI